MMCRRSFGHTRRVSAVLDPRQAAETVAVGALVLAVVLVNAAAGVVRRAWDSSFTV